MRRLIALAMIVAVAGLGCGQKKCPQTAKSAKKPSKRVGDLTLDGVPKELPPELKDKMTRYLNVRSSSFVDWGEKDSGILIKTRFGNTTQVHKVGAPLGARQQMTFFAEPVGGASWVPNSFGASMVVMMDQGGAENYQLFRMDLLEGKLTALTDKDSRTTAYHWSSNGKLAFTNNKRNGKDFDLYIKADDSSEPKLVLETTGYWVPLDFSGDEKKLLMLEYISRNKSNLHIVDLESGKAESVVPPSDGMVYYGHAVWDKDGKGVFFISDQDGEFAQLYHYDLGKKKLTAMSDKIPWNVTELAISFDFKNLAFVTNEDGTSKLYLVNPKNKKSKQVKLPDGVISGLKFSKDRKTHLGFTLAKPNAPADAYSIDPKKGKLIQWTQSEVGGLVTDFMIAPTLVRYPTFDKVEDKPREISAYYFKPSGDGPHPVLIHIHGGPESQYRPYFSSFFQYLLMELGVAVIAPNVRGSDGYGKSYLLLDNGKKREDSVKDIGALLEWVEKQPELDASRVIVHGGSYGGYMVLASLVHFGKKIVAGIDWVGISSFVTFLKNTKDYRRELRRAEYGDESDKEMAKFLNGISPLTHAKKISSKLFVLQGANDPRVPASEAEQLVKAVRQSGKKVWYMLAHNEGHGFRRKDNRDLAQVLTALFVQEAIKKQAPKAKPAAAKPAAAKPAAAKPDAKKGGETKTNGKKEPAAKPADAKPADNKAGEKKDPAPKTPAKAPKPKGK